MRRTRHTRKRHTRKHKRKRTRRGGLGVGMTSTIIGGGWNTGGGVVITSSPIGGGMKIKGGKKYNFPTYMISDISPGDKRAMSSDRRKFKKWKKSLKHKSRKHKRKHKSKKRKRRRRKH